MMADDQDNSPTKTKRKLGRPPRAAGERSITVGFSLTTAEIAKVDAVRLAMVRVGRQGEIESPSRAEFARMVLRACIGGIIMDDIIIPSQLMGDMKSGRRELLPGEKSETVIISLVAEEKEIFDMIADGLGINRSMLFRLMFGRYTNQWMTPFDIASLANRNMKALQAGIEATRAKIDASA